MFEDWKRIEVVNTLIEETNNEFIKWRHQPVMDMSIRCTIDGGARVGRQAGAGGQTIEGHSFKGMKGLENALIPAFFVSLAFTGNDSHDNYGHYGKDGLHD